MGILDRLSPAPRAETTTLRSPATWFLEALGLGRESVSGVRVSEGVALSLSAYYCGVSMIARTIASLPLNVYRRDGRKRDVADGHPVHWLLHNAPNPHMTAMSMRQSWLLHAIGRGNCYGEIVRDGRGQIAQIWPLLPTTTKPILDDEGELWYEIRPWEEEVRYLRAADVLHVPGLGFDGIVGCGLLQVAGNAIGLNAAQDQYAAKFFRNGGTISGAIESPNVLKQETFDRLKREIAEKFTGLENAHRVAILEAGLKFNPLNPTHEEAQLIETRRFSVEEWARWLNMPPHKLKEMSKATFSNIEHQNIEWVVDTLRPWLVAFEQEFNRKLFRKQDIFYTKHVVEGLLRGDLKTRYDAYAVARNWGWMSADDVLELEDRNPLPGDQGSMYLVPANMQPADKVGKEPPAPASPSALPAPGPEEEEEEDAADVLHRRVAAERVVVFGERADRTAVALKAQEWLGCSARTAEQFVELSLHLDLLAEEAGVSAAELRKRKVETLVSLVIGEAHA